MNTVRIPSELALYIHLPWCIQKCPYCDFNSHTLRGSLPESAYLKALQTQINHYRSLLEMRNIVSVFIGGGTPSLFSASAIEKLLQMLDLPPHCEVTLEANPGTFEQERFAAYCRSGINRLSLGIQSFHPDHLKALGRIHDDQQSHLALAHAKGIGFKSINVDLMFALPKQSTQEALEDLQIAIGYAPNHLSWYQLTLEPNTPFYHTPPPIPSHDMIVEISEKGQTILAQAGYDQYEVSAYAQNKHCCQHNQHVWQFGDYLGLGAGAHSKVTTTHGIQRWLSPKHPKAYMKNPCLKVDSKTLSSSDTIFEYMLNHLRLDRPIYFDHFYASTGLDARLLQPMLQKASDMGWLSYDTQALQPTKTGRNWLDDLTTLFLPKGTTHD